MILIDSSPYLNTSPLRAHIPSLINQDESGAGLPLGLLPSKSQHLYKKMIKAFSVESFEKFKQKFESGNNRRKRNCSER